MTKLTGDELKNNQFVLPHYEAIVWINNGKREIISRFKLKLPSGRYDYPDSYFIKKNSNRYFRKHFGFTYAGLYNNKLFKNGTLKRFVLITVNDYKKLMLFKLKFDL